jgi:phospholipid/cholesterol/gamma-HCH transport system substrate-binding protein
MESRAYALITGLFVLGIAGCIIAWANWLAKTPIARTDYRVIATGRGVGSEPEAQVRYRGMGVGRVSTIGSIPKDPRRILINIEVDNSIPVTKGHLSRSSAWKASPEIAYVHLQDEVQGHDSRRKKGPGRRVELPLRPRSSIRHRQRRGAIKDAPSYVKPERAAHPDNRKRCTAMLASLERMSGQPRDASARLPQTIGRLDAVLSERTAGTPPDAGERQTRPRKNLPEITREMQALVKDGRALVGAVDKLPIPGARATADCARRHPAAVNALARSVDRSAQRVRRPRASASIAIRRRRFSAASPAARPGERGSSEAPVLLFLIFFGCGGSAWSSPATTTWPAPRRGRLPPARIGSDARGRALRFDRHAITVSSTATAAESRLRQQRWAACAVPEMLAQGKYPCARPTTRAGAAWGGVESQEIHARSFQSKARSRAMSEGGHCGAWGGAAAARAAGRR